MERSHGTKRPTSMMASFPISNVSSASFTSLYRHRRLVSPGNRAERIHSMVFMLCAMGFCIVIAWYGMVGEG